MIQATHPEGESVCVVMCVSGDVVNVCGVDLTILPVTMTEELEVFSLLLLDETSLEGISHPHTLTPSLTHSLTAIHGYQLSPREHVVSLTSCVLDSAHYFAVGTAFVDPTEKEPNRGRIMLFRVSHTSTYYIHT